MLELTCLTLSVVPPRSATVVLGELATSLTGRAPVVFSTLLMHLIITTCHQRETCWPTFKFKSDSIPRHTNVLFYSLPCDLLHSFRVSSVEYCRDVICCSDGQPFGFYIQRFSARHPGRFGGETPWQGPPLPVYNTSICVQTLTYMVLDKSCICMLRTYCLK